MTPNIQRLRTREPLLERLRSETAAQHQELEATVDIKRRLADRESYRQLLARFYGFYAPLELRLSRSSAADIVTRGRLEKARWLAEDLVQLGVPDASQLPQCVSLPAVDTWPRALGTMYVLEGSTLGGRHISALLNAGTPGELPQRFFNSYGSEVGGMWRSFCAVLDDVTLPGEQDAAAENARATFESMRHWLRNQA